MTPVSNKTTSKTTRFSVLFGGTVLMARLVSLMLGPLLVVLAAEFNTSVAVAGQLAAATFVTWGITAPLVGPFSDTYGRRPVLLTGLAILAIGVLGSAAAWNFNSLMAFRLLTGVGAAMIPPTLAAAIADMLPVAERGRGVGLLAGSSWLGVALGVPVVALIGDAWGWRLPFYITGGLLLVNLGLIWVLLPRVDRPKDRDLAFLSRFKDIGRIAAPWHVMIANALQQTALIGLMTYFAAFLIQNHGFNEGATSLPLAMIGTGAFVGSVGGGLIAGRSYGLLGVAIAGLGGGLGVGAIFALGAPIWVVIAASLVASVLLTVSMPVLMILMLELAGKSRATASGMFGASNQLGRVFGASTGGVMLSIGDFAAVGIFCLVASALSAVMVRVKLQKSTGLGRD
jgi:predicted MFS family arabinose efflux permease